MNLLTITEISKQYSERQLFDGASLLINEGDRIGLIGVNGSGKSTLLRLAAGLETPDAGSVIRWGHVSVEYLAQEPVLDDDCSVLDTIFRSDSPQMRLLRDYEQTSLALQQTPRNSTLLQRFDQLTGEMTARNGWAAEANAKAVLTRLGITDFEKPVGALSGGQRKRVALARSLIDRADLLILDEPTNHIDAETVAWLEDYLAATPGALLMVTHDRYFLDRVVNRIVELDRRQLVSYSGNYGAYLEGRAERHERLAATEQKQRKLLARELAWLRRAPSARGTKQKARSQRVEALQQIQHDSGDERVAMALAGRRLGKSVLAAHGLTKRYGEGDQQIVALDGVDFALAPGDRIGLMGPNGAGKSTLLNALAGKVALDGGTVAWGETVELGYYDQQAAGLDESLRLIEFVENEAPLIRTKDGDLIEAAKMLEWFLFPRSMQWGRIGSLSGGERRRLYLLRTLIHRPNVLLLDEPTNDLDIQTLTVLEQFLDEFEGALVVVSHDRYFLDRTVDYLLPLENGRLGRRYPTPYSSYVRLRQEAEAARASEQVAGANGSGPAHVGKGKTRPTPSGSTAIKPARLSWKQRQELAALEGEIEKLETQQKALTAEMVAAGSDYVRLQTLSAETEQVAQALEQALERWLTLEELKDDTS